MSKSASNQSSDELKPEQVEAYLRRHPEFLRKHPGVLARLDLPGEDEGAASLLQRQTRMLRERNDQLERRLAELTRIADQNEKLLTRLHRLNLALTSTATTKAFLDLLDRRLSEEFDASANSIVLRGELEPPLAHPILRHAGDASERTLKRLLDLKRPECGRLTRAKVECLFGEPRAVGSAAVVPLPEVGLLAIASDDPQRFVPDMGVLFLRLLGETVAWRLQQTVNSERRRA